MNLNDLISYAYTNKIDFNKDISILSESLIEKDETALSEDSISLAISHNENSLVIIPTNIGKDTSNKKELKKRKIDNIESEIGFSNLNIEISPDEITVEKIKDILKNELKFKDFAEVSIMDDKIFIQVSEKAKTDKIINRLYGYNVFFDKINSVWFKNKDLDYHWEYGEKKIHKK